MPRAPNPDQNKTLSQAVADQLASEIICGKLRPGVRLDEQSIANRFEVSRSPVRDALRQLAATKMVLYIPHRGFSVAAVDASALESLFETAGEIEALCAKWCALRAGAAERKRIGDVLAQGASVLQAGDAKSYSRLNDELHTLIYAGAHNPALAEIAHNLRQRLAAFRSNMFFTADNRMRMSHAEHAELVDAILTQDAGRAARAMRDHAAHSAMNALQHFVRANVRADTGLATAAALR